MSGTTTDLRQMANQYRDHLKAELAKVEEFLTLADHLSKASENMRSAFPAPNGSESSVEDTLNLFNKTN